MRSRPEQSPDFCGDDELGFERNRTRFSPEDGLRMDELYRLAHLPLIAADHPDVIASRAGAAYDVGRHPRIYSLVAPVPAEVLLQSPSYRELEGELRASAFHRKIAWNLLDRRKEKLHATICGSLSAGHSPVVDDATRRELSRLGPVRIQLRGLFSGNVNIGRLYIRVYPERRNGENIFRRIQRIMGRVETDLYLVGLFNMVDHLEAEEAWALSELIDRWWDRPLADLQLDRLWLMGAKDDLVLDAKISAAIPLKAGSSGARPKRGASKTSSPA